MMLLLKFFVNLLKKKSVNDSLVLPTHNFNAGLSCCYKRNLKISR